MHPTRLALVVKLVGYLAELARVPRIGPLYACDQHSDNFGVDGAGHLKLLDVDALFTAQDLARHRKNSCIDDWECSVCRHASQCRRVRSGAMRASVTALGLRDCLAVSLSFTGQVIMPRGLPPWSMRAVSDRAGRQHPPLLPVAPQRQRVYGCAGRRAPSGRAQRCGRRAVRRGGSAAASTAALQRPRVCLCHRCVTTPGKCAPSPRRACHSLPNVAALACH